MNEIINEIRKDKQVKLIEVFAEIDNEIALNFYKKHGFQVEGRLRNSYKRAQDDHFVDEIVLSVIFD